MAVTEEQSAALLTRVEGGEEIREVVADLGIERDDFRAWRAENGAALIEARQAGRSARRLTRLGLERTRAQAKLDMIDAEIAEIESE